MFLGQKFEFAGPNWPFMDEHNPVELILNSISVPGTTHMAFNQRQSFLEGESSTRVTIGSNLLRKLPFIFVGRLGELQERRQQLASDARSIVQDLRSVNSLASAINTLVVPAMTRSPYADPAPAPRNQANACVASPHPCWPVQQFGSFQEDVYAYVMSSARFSDKFLRRELLQCVQALRWASAGIAIIQKPAHSLVSFFCSVRWERRRWFVFHGSRPPRQSVQAIMGLFAGACSRSLFAN